MPPPSEQEQIWDTEERITIREAHSMIATARWLARSRAFDLAVVLALPLQRYRPTLAPFSTHSGAPGHRLLLSAGPCRRISCTAEDRFAGQVVLAARQPEIPCHRMRRN